VLDELLNELEMAFAYSEEIPTCMQGPAEGSLVIALIEEMVV
jgi:hypothetical protein